MATIANRIVQALSLLAVLSTAATATTTPPSSRKGLVVWDNTAFGLAAAPRANNAWKEFKDFIGDASAGLGGTIYKDCSDGYFKHYTAAFTAAAIHFATATPPVRVSPGFSMIHCGAADCGVADAQAIVDYLSTLSPADATTLATHLDGHLEMWMDFEPPTPAAMPVYFTALASIRALVDQYNTTETTGLKLRLTAFLPMRLHAGTGSDDFRLPCPLPGGGTQTMFVSDCLQQYYLDASILMAYRNVACYETPCEPLADATTCLHCWNRQTSDMEDCYGMIAWSTIFADGAANGNGNFSIAIETDPTAPNAYEISFGQPNLNGNITYLDAQVDLAISTLVSGGHASVMATNPIVVHDYKNFFCFINNRLPMGFAGDCPVGTATHCDPTSHFAREDLNYDGVVDRTDLEIIQAAMGSCTGDLDGDGTVDGADVGILIGAWGGCPR
ncbi:MAG: hypothetical protein ACYSUU_05950 [Planctomycetota bacterium]|jgi:hypothetical protein